MVSQNWRYRTSAVCGFAIGRPVDGSIGVLSRDASLDIRLCGLTA